MKQIKTIWQVRNDKFDEHVNRWLSEGWELVRREVLIDRKCLDDSVFYAELELEVQTDE